MTTTIFAIYQIEHNHDKEYFETDDVDPHTFKIRVVPVFKTLTAGLIHDVHDYLASELISCNFARLPTVGELEHFHSELEVAP